MSQEKKQEQKKYQKTTVRLKSVNPMINTFYGSNSVYYDLVIQY